MSVHYQDGRITLHLGDAVEVLAGMPDGSVDCIVTSPPYYGLRDYGVDGQIGAEESPAEYVASLVSVFSEAKRVLADDGTLWLNLGDSYQSTGGKTGVGPNAKVGSTKRQEHSRTRPKSDLPSKNMIGIPWRVAFALQDDGWILRNDIIWEKPNAMPQSVRDRFSTRYEHIFLLSKSPRYRFNLDAVREPQSPASIARARGKNSRSKEGVESAYHGNPPSGLSTQHERDTTVGKNPGDVWRISTRGFPEAHFATFPVDLPDRAIRAGGTPGGTVLDPFSGSGTTGLAAINLGSKYVGIDISQEYLDLSLRTRLSTVVDDIIS